MPKTRALITGITGMVGSHMADLLLKKKFLVYGMYRWDEKIDNISHLVPKINKNNNIFLEYGDLNDLSSLEKVIKISKPEYIFHLAAQSFPQTSFRYPQKTLETNIIGTLNLLEAIRLCKIKPVIHICSSSEIFGRVKKKDLPISEDNSFHPASPYAISKVGTDLLSRYYFEAYKFKTITTRMFTHTGPRRSDIFAESSFAKQIAMIENGFQEPVVYVGNLKSMRTIADVRDACNAYFLLVTKNPKFGEAYNIGGKFSCTVGDILKKLISLSTVKKIKIKIDKKRLRPIDADLQIPNTKKFVNHTGWHPKFTFEQTIKDLLNYWRHLVKKNKNIYLKR